MQYWISYLYLFIVGGIIFTIPFVIAFKKKSISLKNPYDRWLIVAVLAVMILYAVIQGVWTYWVGS